MSATQASESTQLIQEFLKEFPDVKGYVLLNNDGIPVKFGGSHMHPDEPVIIKSNAVQIAH